MAEAAPGRGVVLEGVVKSYREGDRRREVLRGVDAVFEPGRLSVIVGPSGSGKSTLLNLISGVDRADGGSISIDGQTVSGLDEHRRTLVRRRRIGIVFQFFNLIPTLSASENLRLPLELNRVPRDEQPPRIEAALERVGLAHRAAAFPDVLSGGEQQRLALARAMIHRPSVLVADEPTGNLDRENARRMTARMLEHIRADGAVAIVATHSEAIVAEADRRYDLEGGRLVPG